MNVSTSASPSPINSKNSPDSSSASWASISSSSTTLSHQAMGTANWRTAQYRVDYEITTLSH